MLGAGTLAHLKATGLSPQDAINSELDFLREWGEPTPRYARRLDAEAARRGTPTLELVSQYLWTAATSSPPVIARGRVAPALQGPRPVHLRITGPNEAWLLEHAEVWRLDFNATLVRALDFGRTYGLPPDLLGALAERARRLGNSTRDEVRRLLLSLSETLPDATASTPKRMTGALTARATTRTRGRHGT
jgi:hypothetical protein